MESPGFANQASSYSAEVVRRAIFGAYARTAANTPGILAGGLLSATDMQLTAPGSGLSVNVSTGEAIVGGSEGGVQGGYYARNASTTNLAISTANPTNPRIDTVCVTIADTGYTEPTGVSGNAAVLQVVTGTPTSGANLTNLSGKAALPASSLLLGYVLVPNSASNIITADIANKATAVVQGVGGPLASATGMTITPTTTTSFTNILSPTGVTLSCTGQPMIATAGPLIVQLTSAPIYSCFLGFSVDGAAPTAAGTVSINSSGGQNDIILISPWAVITPSAGSHTITLQQRLDSAGAGINMSGMGQMVVYQI